MDLLEDIIVVDFSRYLSGPSAGLRLADMGARVIRIDWPAGSDAAGQPPVASSFNVVNRNKQSYAADLKDAGDIKKIRQLLAKADVLLHNFRPGVMERLGLDYLSVQKINPGIVYAAISGYGDEGPWKDLPGQDLLLQSVSGLTWLSNNQDSGPTPMGVAVADIMAGTHITQGILAALYQRAVRGEGALVQVSMLESVLDFQFEVLTCYFNDGGQLPVRSNVNNGHAYIAAPYGIYATTDGYLALSMGNILVLEKLLQCPPLAAYKDPAGWFSQRDEIKEILAAHLATQSTGHWLSILQPVDIWCAKVMDYAELRQEEGYQALKMEIEVYNGNGMSVKTTRCPIRIDGHLLTSPVGAPLPGEHNEIIEKELEISN